jgi:hypothetical protein
MAGCVWYESEAGWTVGKVEKMVSTDLPVGATTADVEAWLYKQGLVGKYYRNAGGNPTDRDNELAWSKASPEQAGLNRAEIKGMMWATIEHANTSLIWDGEIDIFFFFDANDRLIGHRVGRFNWAI